MPIDLPSPAFMYSSAACVAEIRQAEAPASSLPAGFEVRMAAPKDSAKTHLSDYQESVFAVPTTHLLIDIGDEDTVVASTMYILQRKFGEPLVLNGQELELLSIKINGRELPPSSYYVAGDILTIPRLPDNAFMLQIRNRIYPKDNTALMGLYQSKGVYCTQCEPEAFRRITYAIDRPDVPSVFTTTIRGDKTRLPIMISNGNLVKTKTLEDGRHETTWHDPFAKPTYLFALIAGDLAVVEEHFVTCSGRDVSLQFYVRHGDENRVAYAMQSLKDAMKWDEDTFGREYDLDVLKVVAIDDFNMGAMENKGLLIFNSRLVLVSPETATDQDYDHVQSVIAHEYFHNWTGNRVTIRDWFQLTLKEGLTIFRDQEFSADMGNRDVVRLGQIAGLIGYQYPEDAGPMAHPVQPKAYVAIDNFYTATVYSKGAEVCRMIKEIVGNEAFHRGMDLYFDTYDGQAATVESFVSSMEKASGQSLTQFRRWYRQAGTPLVLVNIEYDPENKEAAMTLRQQCGANNHPFVIPMKFALLDSAGNILKESSVVLTEEVQTLRFADLHEKPIPSLFRDLSAPVIAHYPYTQDELATLMAHDTNAFTRWYATKMLLTAEVRRLAACYRNNEPSVVSDCIVQAVRGVLNRYTESKGLAAAMLLPPQLDILLSGRYIEFDIDSASYALRELQKHIAGACKEEFESILREIQASTSHLPVDRDPTAAEDRSLIGICLQYLCSLDDKTYLKDVVDLFHNATNMTESLTALSLLCNEDIPERVEALNKFYNTWKDEPLIMLNWFGLQAIAQKEGVLDDVKRLEQDPAFSMQNPNCVHSLVKRFAHNAEYFHDAAGTGYEYLADKIIQIDAFNPHVAASLAKEFHWYPYLPPHLKTNMTAQLQRILNTQGLSDYTREVVMATLVSGGA